MTTLSVNDLVTFNDTTVRVLAVHASHVEILKPLDAKHYDFLRLDLPLPAGAVVTPLPVTIRASARLEADSAAKMNLSLNMPRHFLTIAEKATQKTFFAGFAESACNEAQRAIRASVFEKENKGPRDHKAAAAKARETRARNIAEAQSAAFAAIAEAAAAAEAEAAAKAAAEAEAAAKAEDETAVKTRARK
jgi:hypothetical protein